MITDKLYQKWGNEAKLKMKIAEHLSKGDKEHREKQFEACKTVLIVLGDSVDILEEIKIAVSINLPIIVVKGTDFTDGIIESLGGNQAALSNPNLQPLLAQGKFYSLESDKAEDLAAMTHFFLTIRPY